jgi:hypothetical protein
MKRFLKVTEVENLLRIFQILFAAAFKTSDVAISCFQKPFVSALAAGEHQRLSEN